MKVRLLQVDKFYLDSTGNNFDEEYDDDFRAVCKVCFNVNVKIMSQECWIQCIKCKN